MGVVLLFLKTYWKAVIIGVLVMSLFIYIGVLKAEISHYKTKWQVAEAEIVAAKGREDRLAAANAGLTEKYKGILTQLFDEVNKSSKILQEKIKNDKELNSLRISIRALRLFNESKRNPSGTPTKAIQGDVGSASGSEASTNPDDPSLNGNGITVPLSTVFAQVAENDANHWKCVEQVGQWQNFWSDYEQAVLRTEERPKP